MLSSANPHLVAHENIEVSLNSSVLSMDVDHPSVTRELHVRVLSEDINERMNILFSLGYYRLNSRSLMNDLSV